MTDTRHDCAIPCESLPWYGLAALAVVTFVNTFPVWSLLAAMAGPGPGRLWLPIALTVGALLAFGVWQRHRLIRADRTQRLALAGGLLLAGLGLALSDPAFPAKRIHVIEYILLAAIVRRALAVDADGWPLTVATALVTALFGVHDELLQGLHPRRTFGLIDLVDNTVAATAGALLGHAVALGHGRPGACQVWPRPGAWLVGFGALIGGLGLMLVGLWYTGVRLTDLSVAVPVPLWTAAPVLGGAVAVSMLEPPAGTAARHVVAVSMVLALSAIGYGVMSHVLALPFR